MVSCCFCSVLCSLIYCISFHNVIATTIFTHVASSLFGTKGENWGVPLIVIISKVIRELGLELSWLSKQLVYLLGFKRKGGDAGVSDSELRLIVMGARGIGTIDHSEGEMIKGGLNLQSQRVKKPYVARKN